MEEFSAASHPKCPICKKWFRSDECPHSVKEARERVEFEKIRKYIMKHKNRR